MMTIKFFLENRPSSIRGKKIRVLNSRTKKYIGHATMYLDREIKSYKVTTKYIFIYI